MISESGRHEYQNEVGAPATSVAGNFVIKNSVGPIGLRCF